MRVLVLFERGHGGELLYATGNVERESDRAISLSNVTVMKAPETFKGAVYYEDESSRERYQKTAPDLEIGQPFIITTQALPET